MSHIPWREEAVLLSITRDEETGETNRAILLEDSLRGVVRRFRAMSEIERTNLKITLPDRRVPPYQYEGSQITDLSDEFEKIVFK